MKYSPHSKSRILGSLESQPLSNFWKTLKIW